MAVPIVYNLRSMKRCGGLRPSPQCSESPGPSACSWRCWRSRMDFAPRSSTQARQRTSDSPRGLVR